MATERTFIMIKPDGVQRGLIGKVMERFEQKGFKLVAMKMKKADPALLEEHYAEHKGRPFLPGMVKYMSSGPVVAMVWEGADVIKSSRGMMGATKPTEAERGTLRGDFCLTVGRNLIHGSDSAEAAQREINLWFSPAEIVSWTSAAEAWLYE